MDTRSWRSLGDVTAAQWSSTIRAAGGPAELASPAVYGVVKGHSALALAMLAVESQYGTAFNNNKRENLNPWNLRPPTGGGYRKYRSYVEAAAEWVSRLLTDIHYKGGVYQRTETLMDLINVYAPRTDNNNPEQYVSLVNQYISRWRVTGGSGMSEGSVRIGDRPLHIAIGAGHRHTLGDMGNQYEARLNGEKVNAVLNLLDQSQGFEYKCYTPNRGLGLFPGYLNDAAAEAVRYDREGWAVDIFVELHSEGTHPSVRGLFIIFPDFHPDVDVDVRDHGTEMAKIMADACGFPLRTTNVVAPGVMSERQTGVGAQGARLGVFRDTASLISTSSRLLVEAGAHSNAEDRVIMDRYDFLSNQAYGLVEALASLAKVRMGWTAAYKIGPDSGEVPPPPVEEIPKLANLTWEAVKRLYNPLGITHPSTGARVVFDNPANHMAYKAWAIKSYEAGEYSPLVAVIRRGDGSFLYHHADGKIFPSGK